MYKVSQNYALIPHYGRENRRHFYWFPVVQSNINDECPAHSGHWPDTEINLAIFFPDAKRSSRQSDRCLFFLGQEKSIIPCVVARGSRSL